MPQYTGGAVANSFLYIVSGNVLVVWLSLPGGCMHIPPLCSFPCFDPVSSYISPHLTSPGILASCIVVASRTLSRSAPVACCPVCTA